jgi:hypothetical protein
MFQDEHEGELVEKENIIKLTINIKKKHNRYSIANYYSKFNYTRIGLLLLLVVLKCLILSKFNRESN